MSPVHAARHSPARVFIENSGVVAGGKVGKIGGGAIAPPRAALNFRLSDNCRKIFVLSKNFVSRNAKFEAENLVGKFRGKIKILSTHDLLCRKFATSFQPMTPLIANVLLKCDSHKVESEQKLFAFFHNFN